MANTPQEILKNKTITFIKSRVATEVYLENGYIILKQEGNCEDYHIAIPVSDNQILIDALLKIDNALL